jgi:hypothetical protein
MIEKFQRFFHLHFPPKKTTIQGFGALGQTISANSKMIAGFSLHQPYINILNNTGNTLLNTISTTGISFHQHTNIFVAI